MGYPLISCCDPQMAAQFLEWANQEYNADVLAGLSLSLQPSQPFTPTSVPTVDIILHGAGIHEAIAQPIWMAGRAFYSGWNRNQMAESDKRMAEMDRRHQVMKNG